MYANVFVRLEEPKQIRIKKKLGQRSYNGSLAKTEDLTAFGLMEGRRIDAYTAAALGDLETLEEVVRPQNINLKNIVGWTMLMYACYYDRLEVVKFLVSLGVDKSIRCSKGRTALMIAAVSGNVDLIPFILESEILELKDERGMTALCLSIEHGHQNAAEILLSKGADPDILLEDGTLLMITAKHGHYSLAKMLLGFGADPLIADSNGKIVVDLAAENGHYDIAELINTQGMIDIQSILTNLGLEQYLQMFKEKSITVDQLKEMSEEDMKIIGMRKFGPRRKLSIFINHLKERDNACILK